jgi:acetylornithine deacetylase/succinyl-diaminopimelate desuccinylase-like protein
MTWSIAMIEPRIAEFVEDQRDRFLDELMALVAIPSISTLPEHRSDVQRAAQFLVAQLRDRAGLEVAELIESERGGSPLVYGEWLRAPGKPTVLIYGHYDVQPIDPIDEWRTPPFEPVVDGDNLRGRGAVDDKGPTLATIKALETLCALDNRLPVNVRVLLEGEEESGGETIAQFVQEHPERLSADCALILDTGMVDVGIPTLNYALRGLVYFEIHAQAAEHDMHSGTYGGIAPNPIQALCWILAEMKDRSGVINIPGLYELIRPISADERAGFERQSPAEAERLTQAAGLHELTGEQEYSVVERATARPTFEVHGIRGGFTGEGAKTVIPATAVAKVSLRLVADQTPDAVLELVRRRIATLDVPGVKIEVRALHGGDAMTFPTDAPVLQAAAAALQDEFGREVEFVRSGGSIPVAALFATVLQLPAVMMGFGLPDDNVHAPNEKFYLPNYYAAIRSVVAFLQRLGA